MKTISNEGKPQAYADYIAYINPFCCANGATDAAHPDCCAHCSTAALLSTLRIPELRPNGFSKCAYYSVYFNL